MDMTPPTSSGAHPDPERTGASSNNASPNAPNGSTEPSNSHNNGPSQAIGAAAAAQQPKVVQTAFIHKLYKYVCRTASYGVVWLTSR